MVLLTGIMFDRNRPLPSPQIAQSLRQRKVSSHSSQGPFHNLPSFHHLFILSSSYLHHISLPVEAMTIREMLAAERVSWQI